ncbi:DUF5753 domain-containing protein [Nocardia sp. NBC_01388]|uniref:DUF5753 domain-containing protein n=1 Tax=Nocardia sp. NBC_01388 TaxID=2903596 RepID=UPI003253C85C
MRYNSWYDTCPTGLGPLQQSILAEEARTRLIRDWQPGAIIGLLQTQRYARAILHACITVLDIPNDLDTVVAARMRRQQILDRDGHEFRFLIGEWVLYRTVGTHAIMGEQLAHLLDAMGNPRLSLGIVPMDAEFRAPAAQFVIHDNSEVSSEAVGGEIIIDDPEGIALHANTFQILSGQAVFDNDARQLITKALQAHHTG